MSSPPSASIQRSKSAACAAANASGTVPSRTCALMCWEIHLAEQATVHIRVVAVGIERADRVILVEVVSRHITKGEQARSMTFDEQGIDSFRRRAGRQAQHRPAANCARLFDCFDEEFGGCPAGNFCIWEDE